MPHHHRLAGAHQPIRTFTECPDPHFKQRDGLGGKTVYVNVSSYTLASTSAFKGISVIYGTRLFCPEQLSFEQSFEHRSSHPKFKSDNFHTNIFWQNINFMQMKN